MGGPKIAAHAQRPSKDSKLQRGKTYLFDAMGLLYAMATRAEIADALGQTPPVPTRDVVRMSIACEVRVCICYGVWWWGVCVGVYLR